jgi:hypothetical protein
LIGFDRRRKLAVYPAKGRKRFKRVKVVTTAAEGWSLIQGGIEQRGVDRDVKFFFGIDHHLSNISDSVRFFFLGFGDVLDYRIFY